MEFAQSRTTHTLQEDFIMIK